MVFNKQVLFGILFIGLAQLACGAALRPTALPKKMAKPARVVSRTPTTVTNFPENTVIPLAKMPREALRTAAEKNYLQVFMMDDYQRLRPVLGQERQVVLNNLDLIPGASDLLLRPYNIDLYGLKYKHAGVSERADIVDYAKPEELMVYKILILNVSSLVSQAKIKLLLPGQWKKARFESRFDPEYGLPTRRAGYSRIPVDGNDSNRLLWNRWHNEQILVDTNDFKALYSKMLTKEQARKRARDLRVRELSKQILAAYAVDLGMFIN